MRRVTSSMRRVKVKEKNQKRKKNFNERWIALFTFLPVTFEQK